MKRLFPLLILWLLSTMTWAQHKVMVAYFSATGTTEAVAVELADCAGAFLWKIVPYEEYTDADLDWRDKKSRSSLEMADPEERPTIKMCTDVRPYDIIFLGFPIWWGVAPRIINSWLDNSDFSGKIIIPFATSGSSDITKAVEELRKTYPEYTFFDGRLMNQYSADSLVKWVNAQLQTIGSLK